ncbi:MAG TPA: tyrosine-type recombinase/integrase [Gemmatimonadaceae bacterium]
MYKRSDGMWIGAVDIPTADGKRRRKTVSSRDRGEAIRKHRELLKDVAAGKVSTSPSTTVGKWLDYWLRAIVEPNVGPSTFRHYEQSARLHIKPRIGHKRLDRLTLHDLREMIADIQQSSTRAAQKAHGTLQTALKAAEAEGVVGRNLAAALPVPEHLVIERDPLAVDAAQHIITTAITSCDAMWASRWCAAFVTGARPAELRGLRWSYVDLDAGETDLSLADGEIDLAWQLRRLPRRHGCGEPPTCGKSRPAWCPSTRWRVPPGFDMQECYKSMAFTRPKTKAGTRLVPLVAPMLAMLRRLRELDTGPNPNDLVWHWPDGRPHTQEDENDAWLELMRAAGLTTVDKAGKETAPIIPYVARHSAATLLLKAGVAESTRMKIIGHSSVVAQRIYAHEDQALARDAMANLSSLMPAPVDLDDANADTAKPPASQGNTANS